MEEETGLLRYNIKISLTGVKVCYSICFMVILALIRGVSYSDEIGAAMDANVSLLAIVFCADTYYQEVAGNRWEVFNLISKRNRYRTLIQRLCIQIIYITVLICTGYWLFYLQKLFPISGENELTQYITAVLACSASVIFFAALAFTMVNVFGNLWAGIGSTLLLWLMLNSTFGRDLPGAVNIFAYGSSLVDGLQKEWIMGKVNGVLLSMVLMYINKSLLVWRRKG